MLRFLYLFQEIEKKERELKQSLKTLPEFKELKRIKEKFSLNQEKLVDAKNAYENLSQRLKKAEQMVDELEIRQKELNGLLYSGTIKNSKELESMEQQLKAVGEQVSKESDVIIQMLEEKEGIGKTLISIEVNLKKEYRAFNELKLSYNQLKLNLDQEIKVLKADKNQLIAQLDQNSLDWYKENKEKFKGMPVAKILENHACGGCHTLIPITIVKEARIKGNSVYCEKCGRMLYAPRIN